MPGYDKRTLPDESLVNVQIFNQEKKSNFLANKQAQLPIQPLTLSSPFMPPQFTTYLSNFMKNFYTPFIYKDYNIRIGGPAEDNLRASMIYEDALPALNVYYSYKTLRDRNNLTDFIRSNFLNGSDGELTNFSGEKNSLNSRLKLIKLAPFTNNIWSSNPYYSLPPGILLYSSCYPIIADRKSGVAQCAKNSVGINVRLYSVTPEELVSRYPYYGSKTPTIVTSGTSGTPGITGTSGTSGTSGTPGTTLTTPTVPTVPTVPNQDTFNIWRELIYYEYIRNSINRGFISPNFIQSYCFFLCADLKIDYSKNSKLDPATLTDAQKKALLAGKKDVALLTESPNMNLIQWTSNLYSSEANINKQLYTGFKTQESWEPILFQMLAVFYLMDKLEFTIVEMNLLNNFFVKDVAQYDGSGNQFWIYRINNIDFYVPCKGELLLVDSDYHNVTKKYKIVMKNFTVNNSTDIKDIKDEVRSNAKNCFDFNNFTGSSAVTLGIARPDCVQPIFNGIYSNLYNPDPTDSSKLISYEKLLLDYFGKFLHNRIGTLIRDNEKDYIKKIDVTPFKRGELVIYEDKYETYEILLYLENVDEYKCNCITRKVVNGKVEVSPKSVSKDMLYHYSDYEQIKQDILPGQPSISSEYLIETYIL